MSRRFRPALALAALVGLALATLAAVGCSKKVAVGDYGSELVAYPEGTRDTAARTPSELIVWPDDSIGVYQTQAGPNGVTVTTYATYRIGPGTMHGLIADYMQAGGYQVFRQEPGGGFRQFTDFVLTAIKRWGDRIYYGGPTGTVVLPPAQMFAFSDRAPTALSQRSYVGRAVSSGLSGVRSALTNTGTAPDTLIPTLRYTGLTALPSNPDNIPWPPDSLLEMSWESVPGAASYWVHIFQKRADIRSSEEAIAIGLPSPIAQGKVRDLFIGTFPAPDTAYKLGDTPPLGSRILVYRVLTGLQEVLIRVSAVDAQGRMIATTGVLGGRDSVLERIGGEDRLRKFQIGAMRITPGRPVPPP